jgi:uncharacterized protein YaaN involved in tellurite resistance
MDDELITSSESGELSEEEKSRIEEIKNRIDVSDSNAILQYGVAIQGKISEFADNMLAEVKAKDTGYVGKILSDLMINIRELNVESLSGKKSILSRIPLIGSLVDSAKRFSIKYQSLSTQIVTFIDELEEAKARLMKDVDMLDNFYERTLEYFKELSIFIIAGEQKLSELHSTVLPEYKARADESDDPLAAQKYKDMVQLVDRLDKKLHDLRLSKTVALQAGPQIRLIQNNNRELAEKIQSSILNTIPLWKNQIVIAISLLRQQQASALQGQVSKTTNELLEKNAEMLKVSSIEVAKEAQKGVIDIDTLKKVNADLISTIDETLKLQQEGITRRQEAEQELIKIENELKEKLKAVRTSSSS